MQRQMSGHIIIWPVIPLKLGGHLVACLVMVVIAIAFA